MPSALELDFLKYTLESQEKKHQRWNFQVGGLYVIGTPESEFYRPIHRKPRGYKIGKSLDLLSRLNQYTLVCPWDSPALKVHCLLLMPHSNKADKLRIDQCEAYVLRTLKERYPQLSHWPGIDSGTRKFFSRSEWIQACNLEEVEKVVKSCEGPNDLFVQTGPNTNVPAQWYAFKHRQEEKNEEKREEKREKQPKRKADTASVYEPRKFVPRTR